MATLAAILLAAGESTRMGTPKPLLEWMGGTLMEYQVVQLREARCDPVIAVLGHAADEVRPLAERAGVTVVINRAYAEGRAGSLRAGAAAVAGADAIVILSVDQPRPTHVIRRLIDAHQPPITLPTHEGNRGHPAVVSGDLLDELRAADDTTKGLRGVIERHRVHEIEFGTALVLLDLNTPEDYEEANMMFASESLAIPPLALDDQHVAAS